MLLTLVTTCLCRVAWIWLVAPRFQTMIETIAAFPVSWLLTAVCFAVYYALFRRRRLVDAEPAVH